MKEFKDWVKDQKSVYIHDDKVFCDINICKANLKEFIVMFLKDEVNIIKDELGILTSGLYDGFCLFGKSVIVSIIYVFIIPLIILFSPFILIHSRFSAFKNLKHLYDMEVDYERKRNERDGG